MNMRSKSSINLLNLVAIESHKLKQNYCSVPQASREPIWNKMNHEEQLKKQIIDAKTLIGNRASTRVSRDICEAGQARHVFTKNGKIESSFKYNESWRKRDKQNLLPKSVYEKYKERIEGGLALGNYNSLKNPELKFLKSENDELKVQMQSDIEMLRLVRKKSQKSLRKSESTKILKTEVPQMTVTIEKPDLKMRALAKNREKLSRIV